MAGEGGCFYLAECLESNSRITSGLAFAVFAAPARSLGAAAQRRVHFSWCGRKGCSGLSRFKYSKKDDWKIIAIVIFIFRGRMCMCYMHKPYLTFLSICERCIIPAKESKY